jgi:hypothetical protein
MGKFSINHKYMSNWSRSCWRHWKYLHCQMWWYRQKYRDGNRHFWIKVNTDGAVNFVNGRAGARMIVRDDQG